MIKNEIGSEFSNEAFDNGFDFQIPNDVRDFSLTFSGRTAIDVVIKNNPNIRKAMLPSYCCDSMIEPFRKSIIDICFYDVNYNNKFQIDIDIPEDVDLLLWCNYFGYQITMPNLESFINRGGIIVEDITHSLYSKQMYNVQSHFIVASLRKWGAVLCGGYCGSKYSLLINKPFQEPSSSFIDKKKEAMKLKEQYLIDGDETKKERYLLLYGESNKWLAENYVNLKMDTESKRILFNKEMQSFRDRRIANAMFLHEGLKNNPNVQCLFGMEEMECPLFVPIIIKNGKRDYYRKRLIDNKIYCPIHWSHPNADCQSNLYDLEISLICDQRYSEQEMERIIDVLSN